MPKSIALPLGVVIHNPIALDNYLPYRIDRLATLLASLEPRDIVDEPYMTTRSWRVMMVIVAYGPSTITQIADRLSVDVATATRGVQLLRKAGYIVSRSPKADRRKQVVTLTVEGGVAYDRIAVRRREDESAVLSALSDADRDALLTILGKLEQYVGARLNVDDDPFADA
ncbi:MarR family winged helix-turn-helix transcriptional regulator [Sphingomonas sp.]|uniref:MarR family winged helix-turn-helix transcriptional regulator n=1 Tax=Sphingomonas sp. TaxID=28214 RepID=UPI0025E90C9E|nr:MarR family winged helix-turn-helix transcriptional regulator [Sphingomonas sp.]